MKFERLTVPDWPFPDLVAFAAFVLQRQILHRKINTLKVATGYGKIAWGSATAGNKGVEGRTFDQLAADVSASQSGANLQNATLRRGNMQIQAAANIGLRNWKALPKRQDRKHSRACNN